MRRNRQHRLLYKKAKETLQMLKWEKLPAKIQRNEVRPYYDILKRKQTALFFKRVFDFTVSLVFLILLSPLFLILAIAIKAESKGPVFYRQKRITRYGKEFNIHKFRSMYNGADQVGPLITVAGDIRVTKVGQFIRKYKLDELAQLIDILQGTMSFVGTRPEIPKYVDAYTPEMMATLLLPAGITNESSINFINESELLNGIEDVDKVYIEIILPQKMYWNLQDVKHFGFWRDIGTIFRTIFAILGIVKPKESIGE